MSVDLESLDVGHYTDAGVLASGQVAGILDDLPSCAELVESIVNDAVKHLRAAADHVVD